MGELASSFDDVGRAFDRGSPAERSGLRLAHVAAEAAGRFCAWRGLSERRYVLTVYAADGSAPFAGLPEFEECVVLAVRRGSLGRLVLDVAALERGSERRAITARGVACGVTEWHVYFVGGSRAERADIVSDLRGRHGREEALARCA